MSVSGPKETNQTGFNLLKGTKMTTYYAIVPTNFEYNDEIYNAEGFDAPLKIYQDKERAERECKKLSLDRMKDLDWNSYEYDIQNIFVCSIEHVEEVLDIVLPRCKYSWEFKMPKLTKYQLEQLYDLVRLRFYHVITVQGE